jgi:hypothetical protein
MIFFLKIELWQETLITLLRTSHCSDSVVFFVFISFQFHTIDVCGYNSKFDYVLFYVIIFYLCYIILALQDWTNNGVPSMNFVLEMLSGRRGRDRVVVGFTTTCSISAYHH